MSPGMSPGSIRVDVDPVPDAFDYSTSTPVQTVKTAAIQASNGR